jgi:hypothetical protein
MSARFHAHPYRNSSTRKLTIKSFGFIAMLQSPFLELSTFRIYTRYLLKLGVKIYSYNDHCSAPFSPACWLVSTTNFTRGWEPTSSWNQYRSLRRILAKKSAPLCNHLPPNLALCAAFLKKGMSKISRIGLATLSTLHKCGVSGIDSKFRPALVCENCKFARINPCKRQSS